MLFKLFGFWEIQVIDVIDILFVAIVLYKLMSIIRDVRAVPLFTGLLLVIIISFIASWFQFSALLWIIDTVKTIWVIAFLIIFQPELRRALTKLGQSKWFNFINKSNDTKTIDLLGNSAENLSKKNLGALIVIIKEDPIENIVETGTIINSQVSEALIETIFTPPSPLHDGALIIKGDLIISAGAILPLTQNQNLDKRLGLRHRAGLGITEESDAVAIIVSEETGQYSFAKDGIISLNLTEEELKHILKEELFSLTEKSKN